MEELVSKLKEIGTGKIATVVGRYYAMDRDKRWERVELALKGMVLGEGEKSDDPVKTVKERYEKGENDEFLKPIVVGGQDGRIKGMLPPFLADVGLFPRTNADREKMMTLSSSSTTAPTAFARSPSSWATLTGLPGPTFLTPRSGSLP